MYTLTCKDENSFSIVLSSDTHPVFQAHFPNNPLLPGFALLDISALVLGVEIVSIMKAKFIKPILPKSMLHFQVKENEKKIKIIVTQNEQKVAELAYEKR